jgi:hypothetical protein
MKIAGVETEEEERSGGLSKDARVDTPLPS